MCEVEIYGPEEEIILKIELPFMPLVGEHLSIEREDYFKYYIVSERWVRISQDNDVISCVQVELKD